MKLEDFQFNPDKVSIIKIPGSKYFKTLIADVYDEALLKELKKKLGCGGNVGVNGLELQGKQTVKLVNYFNKQKSKIKNSDKITTEEGDQL